MNKSIKLTLVCLFVAILNATDIWAENYPDQHYVLYIDSIYQNIESSSNVELSADGKYIRLTDDQTYGYFILNADVSDQPFNRGLPSWNGTAPDENSGFLVQMRFPYNDGWSPWLTVGFWKSYIWNSYGQTGYGGGYIDYDYVKLNSYQSGWQFKIHLARYTPGDPSPTIHKLSFFVSDSRTTADLDMNAILNDKPDEIFIPTDFLYQYALDDEIGPSNCSQTTVLMILHSYDIDLDPVQFARETYDPYYRIFGIWPRVVQNASEFNLDGAVTRYRTWSETREVLENGGRIAMSVGPPLYEGHLMMLAGFTSTGNPIVHDPAKSNGYAYVYNKSSLSHSWFDKGGVAYTFYPDDSLMTNIVHVQNYENIPGNYQLYQNYPNPFNPVTNITFSIPRSADVKITVCDILGRQIHTLLEKEISSGTHSVLWNAADYPSGTYFILLTTADYQQVIRAVLLK